MLINLEATLSKNISIYMDHRKLWKLYAVSQMISKSSIHFRFVFFHLSINPYGNYVMKKVLINGDPSVQYLKLVLKQYPDLIIRIKNSDFG